ncbi:hypothetical protein [Actinokineospora terrae]|uniref:Uncharacterized protein n=1 Tax=Actinokineospora terrae TaxID=155974 RepID=A0A1H9WFZ6_9PSEU|nr:hypothetical protein [Actinokineospora terrae]SES32810.1 hypothetical protein SAMN04487818_110161 [Actinokineospora terrae]
MRQVGAWLFGGLVNLGLGYAFVIPAQMVAIALIAYDEEVRPELGFGTFLLLVSAMAAFVLGLFAATTTIATSVTPVPKRLYWSVSTGLLLAPAAVSIAWPWAWDRVGFW